MREFTTSGTLSVTALDLDGDPLTYLWSYVSGNTVTFTAAAQQTAQFTVDIPPTLPAFVDNASTGITVQIVVDDGQGGNVSQNVDVRFRAIHAIECFAAGTPVMTESGSKPIESIHKGELVWACEVATGAWSLRPVIEAFAFTHWNDDVATISAGGETITATGPHPFWVMEGDGLAQRPPVTRLGAQGCGDGPRWVEARNLKAGDVVCARGNHGRVQIDAVTLRKQKLNTFNLHVAETNTFAVGKFGIAVHNSFGPEHGVCSLSVSAGNSGTSFLDLAITLGWALVLLVAGRIGRREPAR